MAQETDDFAALLAACRVGDEPAIEQLCRQYETKVRIVARILLGPALRSHLDSMDLVQSVHRTLLMGLRQDRFDISDPKKLIALATTLVRRKVARQWRLLRRQRRLKSGGGSSENLVQTLSSLSSPDAGPAQVAQFNDQMAHLCSQMDPTECRILELRSNGYSTGEIAEQLGLKPVTLRVRMTRLRERLRAGGVVDEWV
jgi:RNA polymerase sigma factor (sigma-70 family)